MAFPITRRSFIGAGSLALMGQGLHAQSPFPASVVKILVGFAPGGAVDIVARTLSSPLAERWSQGVVVENRAGASGMLAAEALRRAPPDGHTLMLAPQTSTTMAQALYPERIRYDTRTDFTPLTNLGQSPQVLVVPASSDIHSVTDLVAHAKKNPGRLSYGSGGAGTSLHLAGALLARASGAEMIHVPYKGEAGAVTDLLGNQLSFMFSNTFVILPYIREGRLRALAVSGAQRSPLLPEVPTLASSIPTELDTATWYGLFAPKGLAEPVAEQIVRDMQSVLTQASVRERLTTLGVTSAPNSPAQFNAFLEKELSAAKKVVAETGMTAN